MNGYRCRGYASKHQDVHEEIKKKVAIDIHGELNINEPYNWMVMTSCNSSPDYCSYLNISCAIHPVSHILK